MVDLSAETRAALTDLIAAWHHHRPQTSLLQADFTPVEVPAVLRETITRREPYRRQALADAAVYLTLPYLAGIGLEFTPEVRAMRPFERWPISIAPFNFRLSWTLHLDGREPDLRRDAWARVVLEEGRWKIAAFWDDDARRKVADEITRVQAYLARRCYQPGKNQDGGS